MVLPDDVAKLLNTEPIEISHDFEIELNCLVTINYKFDG